MAKKKAKRPGKPVLVSKILRIPVDWVARIDQARGDQSFSDFVRDAVLEKIDRDGLSEMPVWGRTPSER